MRKKATTRSTSSQTNLTKIGSWSGVPIHVSADGKFYAKIDDIEIEADRLEAVRTKIDAALKPSAKKVPISLPVIVIIEDETIETTTITGISRSNRELQFDPPLKSKSRWHSNLHVLADTSANRVLAETHVAAVKAAGKARGLIRAREFEVNGYGRIEIEQYAGIVASVTAAHKRSAAK